MKKIGYIKRIVVYANLPRYIIHYGCFLLSQNREAILNDIEKALEHRDIQCGNVIISLVFLFSFDQYFRNLFYHRIGIYKHLCAWTARPHPSFIIGTYTPIGTGMLAVHPFSSVINAHSIGENFTIKNDVTIGRGSSGIPTIMDNVEINVGAIIIGGIVIGNNVIVGAGSIVTKDVPENSTVVGNPAYIIYRNGKKTKDRLT